MNGVIDFLMGPMVWISFIVFLGGLGWRVWAVVAEVRDKEHYIFSYLSLFYSLRSIGAWLLPFVPKSTRERPLFYAISYGFHLLVLVVPLFLSAHIVLVEEAFRVSWPALNDGLADIMTLVILAALIFFAGRRLILPEVKVLTSARDFGLLLVVALPFLTGFLAYHQTGGETVYPWIMIAHLISGEALLMIIPFSRLSHMVLAALTRAYTGSEFGKVRHARDW